MNTMASMGWMTKDRAFKLANRIVAESAPGLEIHFSFTTGLGYSVHVSRPEQGEASFRTEQDYEDLLEGIRATRQWREVQQDQDEVTSEHADNTVD